MGNFSIIFLMPYKDLNKVRKFDRVKTYLTKNVLGK